jgi:hypothetical protein
VVGESDDIAGVALGVSDNVAVRTQAYWSFFRGGPWPVLKSDPVSGSVLVKAFGGSFPFSRSPVDIDCNRQNGCLNYDSHADHFPALAAISGEW